MTLPRIAVGLSIAASLASCSVPPSPPPPPPAQAVPPPVAVVPAPLPEVQRPPAVSVTMEDYKRVFAERVAFASPDIFEDPLPEVFKSIVVLDVTIGRDGQVLRVAVHRSNGYKDLEQAALNSVRRAAPFAAPGPRVRRGDGSVNFLETFLFRTDGRYRILSLQQAAPR
jgi:protein TonB